MKKARKSRTRATNPTALIIVVILVLGVIGGVYLAKGVKPSGAYQGTYLTVSRDPSTALSQMTVGGRKNVKDSVWKFAMNGADWYYLTGIRFTMRTSSKTALNVPKAKVEVEAWECSGTSAIPQATAVPGVYTVEFDFSHPCRLNAHSTSYFTVNYDLASIGGLIKNDTRYYTTIEDATDLLWNGADHPFITMDGTNVPVYRYQLESYPTANSFIRNSAGDEIPLVVSKKTWLASVSISAQPEKGVGFTRGKSQNFIKFRVTSHVQDDGIDTGGWIAVDSATGKVLQSSTDDIEGLTTINLQFTNNSLFVPAGGGKVISLYADTTAFEDKGDFIQVGLDGKEGNINWTLTNIPGGGPENFGHGDIIFRGNPSGQKLVKQ